MRLLDGSGVNREVYAPFCERPGVKFLRPTCHRLHWMLDVNFGEDAATVRKDFAADNLSRLKKIVLNVLRLETATAALGKLSLAKKRKLAAWDDSFRMAILGIKPIHDK